MPRVAFLTVALSVLTGGGFAATPITYGSAVKLRSIGDISSKFFLRSLDVQWNNRPSGQNIVTTTSEETSPETYWVVGAVNDGTNVDEKLSGVPVMCGSTIVLTHAVSSRNLQVSLTQKSTIAGQLEVTAVTAPTSDSFTLECPGGQDIWMKDTNVYLKHAAGYLRSGPAWLYTQSNCPRCPIVGQREVVVSPGRVGTDCYFSVEGGVILREPYVENGDDSDEEKENQHEEL